MIKMTFYIDGMHCGMCESHVNNIVRGVSGVKKVKSSHTKGTAEVVAESDGCKEEISKAISSMGYKVESVDVSEYTKRGFFGRREK